MVRTVTPDYSYTLGLHVILITSQTLLLNNGDGKCIIEGWFLVILTLQVLVYYLLYLPGVNIQYMYNIC